MSVGDRRPVGRAARHVGRRDEHPAAERNPVIGAGLDDVDRRDRYGNLLVRRCDGRSRGYAGRWCDVRQIAVGADLADGVGAGRPVGECFDDVERGEARRVGHPECCGRASRNLAVGDEHPVAERQGHLDSIGVKDRLLYGDDAVDRDRVGSVGDLHRLGEACQRAGDGYVGGDKPCGADFDQGVGALLTRRGDVDEWSEHQ